ncbi:excinuclease ABC subunit UvrC [Helicobacter sp. MIT 14-3879]|uniref:excinuclease ABC subunit UvrC n=1 Tax=Helicobacter sp. MIT 14-3879 TaxID=2040649 RepID=UPI000E1FAF8E|nr:excinuclease ABC subunit UvrC [Helicobacter sp. MIT 14-3879]RDU62908.1 excinuclease ABC subunit C [Helicobacter sp. MIT 14-3879]
MKLADIIRHIPHKSGVYQYFDKDYKILYIGKAKDLNKRVRSYFSINNNLVLPNLNVSPRIKLMIKQIFDIKIIITDSEQDALILENSLIKQLKPKYNILLRDDKTYPYIVVDKSKDFPRLEVVRKIINDKNLIYFGPYSSGIKEFVDSIYELVPLVQRNSCLSQKKACLFYQIKRCLAPCEGKITKKDYELILQDALNFLSNPSKLLKILNDKMLFLANSLRFEEANKLKSRIQKLKQITNISTIDLAKLYNFDIFAIVSTHRSVLVKIFMRDGKVTFSDYYFINHNENDIELDYLYTQALINHYKHNNPLNLDSILLPITLENTRNLQEFFLIHFNKKIKIECPKSGDKKRLITLAINNAKNILENNNSDDNNLLFLLKSLLRLENLPNRIEIFDTSHHQGSDCVGVKVVFSDGEFIKDSYKKYLLEGRDEYSQMQELLSRRANRFDIDSPPDLWLIDGGKAQINIAKDIIDSSCVNIDIVAISKEKINHRAYRSKGGARDILRTKDLEIRLEKNDNRLLFLQKLRDEAHRFAITFHRKKKLGSIKNSPYSQAQLKKLLNYFGSFEVISSTPKEIIKEALKNIK